MCSLIEFTARETKNRRGVIVKALGKAGIEKQLHDAEVNHCLSFEQVCDEIVERYQIPKGTLIRLRDVNIRFPAIWNVPIEPDICWTENSL